MIFVLCIAHFIIFPFLFVQMEDDQTLYDYDVGLNDLIQILVRKNVLTAPVKADTEEEDKNVSNGACNNKDEGLSDKENKEVSSLLVLIIDHNF